MNGLGMMNIDPLSLGAAGFAILALWIVTEALMRSALPFVPWDERQTPAHNRRATACNDTNMSTRRMIRWVLAVVTVIALLVPIAIANG